MAKRTMSLRDRLFSHTVIDGDCVLWTGAYMGSRYGAIKIGRGMTQPESIWTMLRNILKTCGWRSMRFPALAMACKIKLTETMRRDMYEIFERLTAYRAKLVSAT